MRAVIIGSEIKEKNNLLLQTPDSLLQRLNVDVTILNEVVPVNTGKKTVMVKNVVDGSVGCENNSRIFIGRH